MRRPLVFQEGAVWKDRLCQTTYIMHPCVQESVCTHVRGFAVCVCVCVCVRVRVHKHTCTHTYMPYVYKTNFNEHISDIGWFNSLTTPSVNAPINA